MDTASKTFAFAYDCPICGIDQGRADFDKASEMTRARPAVRANDLRESRTAPAGMSRQ
jgi:hypothetical protein